MAVNGSTRHQRRDEAQLLYDLYLFLAVNDSTRHQTRDEVPLYQNPFSNRGPENPGRGLPQLCGHSCHELHAFAAQGDVQSMAWLRMSCCCSEMG